MDIPNAEFYRDNVNGLLNLEAVARAGRDRVIQVSFWKTTLWGTFVAGTTCHLRVYDDGNGHIDRDAMWRVIGSSRGRQKVLLQRVDDGSAARVVNVRVTNLRKLGYHSLTEWLAADTTNHVYIGRAMMRVPGAETGSKWANPFSITQYEREGALARYRTHIHSRPDLLAALGELRGKTLGCWCAPERCHGHVLLELLDDADQERLLNDSPVLT